MHCAITFCPIITVVGDSFSVGSACCDEEENESFGFAATLGSALWEFPEYDKVEGMEIGAAVYRLGLPMPSAYVKASGIPLNGSVCDARSAMLWHGVFDNVEAHDGILDTAASHVLFIPI